MITSTTNPTIKQIVRLHTSKGRKDLQQCIAEGIRTIETLIKAGWQPSMLYATRELYQKACEQFSTATITEVSDAVMKKMSSAITPSGLLAVFALPSKPSPSLLDSGIVLAGVRDPGNMGTLIRTCAAFGKKSVVVIDGCDPFSPKVLQSSAGTIAYTNIFQWSWQELLHYKQRAELIALVAHNGQNPEQITAKNTLLVIGSEAHGIRPEWLSSCEQKVTIPMPGGTESLNAAIAGAVAMHAIWIICKK